MTEISASPIDSPITSPVINLSKDCGPCEAESTPKGAPRGAEWQSVAWGFPLLAVVRYPPDMGPLGA